MWLLKEAKGVPSPIIEDEVRGPDRREKERPQASGQNALKKQDHIIR